VLAAGLLVEVLIFIPRGRGNPRIELVPATVTRVIDGRTIEVGIGGETATVRYIGVGVPEIGETNAGLVLDLNRQWVSGKDVVLEKDEQDRDSEGRLLRYVYVDDAMVNAALIAAGFAWAEVPGKNIRYSKGFASLEEQARVEKRGLWALPGGLKGAASLEGGMAPGLHITAALGETGTGALRASEAPGWGCEIQKRAEHGRRSGHWRPLHGIAVAFLCA
jgi:micrococcal nuclease